MSQSDDKMLELVNENTLKVMTPRWVRNIVENEKLIKKTDSKGVVDFFAKGSDKSLFQNIPSVIVSGGPSANKNVHLLKEIQNKAVIIVVDSMVKKVMELGVKPDFVIMTDAEWGEWGNCFEDLPMSTKDIPLLVDVYVNKKIVESWEGDVYWYAVIQVDGSPLSQIVEPEFTGKPIGRLACGGCVSSVAFSFAYGVLRSDPIILIGQDCGYYDRQFHHADGIDVEETIIGEEMIDDIIGRPMMTTIVLKAYKYWFETIVTGKYQPNFPQLNGTFINATEGGCVSKGWLIQPLRFVIDRYLTKEYDISKLIEDTKNRYAVKEPKKLDKAKLLKKKKSGIIKAINSGVTKSNNNYIKSIKNA